MVAGWEAKQASQLQTALGMYLNFLLGVGSSNLEFRVREHGAYHAC